MTNTELRKAEANRDYVALRVMNTSFLKGVASSQTEVRYYAGSKEYRAAVLAAAKTPTILFLTQVDEPGAAGLYFTGDAAGVLQPATVETIGILRSEIARQFEILRSWRPDPSAPYFERVSEIVGAVAKIRPPPNRDDGKYEARRTEQQRLFDQLEKLGTKAVSAIVSAMDDRHPLAVEEIDLANNSPNAFEAVRHYGPKLIVDALAAELNQITGENFGFIYNGGSERERSRTVDGWRIYASMMNATPR